jgi:hypothetical protein
MIRRTWGYEKTKREGTMEANGGKWRQMEEIRRTWKIEKEKKGKLQEQGRALMICV